MAAATSPGKVFGEPVEMDPGVDALHEAVDEHETAGVMGKSTESLACTNRETGAPGVQPNMNEGRSMNKITTMMAVAVLIFTAGATSAYTNYDLYGREGLIQGKTAKYELAGQLLAYLESEYTYCDRHFQPSDLDLDYIKSLAGTSDESKLAVFYGGYMRARTDGHYAFADCRKIHASAANFGIFKAKPMSDAERDDLVMIGVLDNNNCFYEGTLPDDKEGLWKLLARERFDYISATREGGYEVYEEGQNLGVSDDFDCSQLAAFGVRLETLEED